MKKKILACYYILTRRNFAVFAYNKDECDKNGAVVIIHHISTVFASTIAEFIINNIDEK